MAGKTRAWGGGGGCSSRRALTPWGVWDGGPRAPRRQVFTGPLLRAGQALGPISEWRHRPQAPMLPGPERGPRGSEADPLLCGAWAGLRAPGLFLFPTFQ